MGYQREYMETREKLANISSIKIAGTSKVL
jgi:hypothetical protein